MTVSADLLRQGYAHFPSGIVAVCATGPDRPIGMAVSTFVPVSLDPPLVGICLQTTSRTWAGLRSAPRLGVSILSEDHDRAARTLAAKDGDRFAGVGHDVRDSGAVVLAGAAGSFECSLERELPAGDHVLALLRVHDLDASGAAPLIFHRSGFERLATPPRTVAR